MFTNLRLLLEIAVSAGLATGLSLLTLFRMPQGGSVTLVMLPLLYLSLRHGVAVGCGAGFLVGVAQYLVGGFFVHPIQLVMDYPLAFTVVALGGLARKIEYAYISAIIAVVVGGTARFGVHFSSGIVFFGHYAPKDQPVWLYSLIYNAAYLLPEMLFCAILLPPVLRRMRSAIDGG